MAVAQANRIDLSDTGLTDAELFAPVELDAAAVEKITAPRYSYWHSVFRVFFRKKSNILILAALAFIIVFTYIYPAVMGYDRYGNIMDSTAKLYASLHMLKTFMSVPWMSRIISGFSTFGARSSRSQVLA